MNGSTDWLSAIGILLSGVILGFMFIYAQLRKRGAAAAAAAPADDVELLDLQARRDALIQQLRDLEDEGVTNGQERARLEKETAEVLRAIDAHAGLVKTSVPPVVQPAAGTAPAAAPRPSSGFFAQHPAVKGFVWGVGSIAALALLGVYVYRSATQKVAAAAPSSMSPAAQTTTDPHQQQAATTDPAVQQLEQEVRNDPENVDKRIDLARLYLDHENMMGVFEQTKAVLEKHPDEPRAQAYNAIVRMAMGQTGQAKAMLETATKTDPKLVDAWVALAWLHAQKGEKDLGKGAIDQAIKNSPQNEARLREVWEQMSKQPATADAAAVGNPHVNGGAPDSLLPQGHPPVADNGGQAAVASSPAADPASAIHLTLMLDGTAKARSGVLFVIARAAGQSEGMPLAVKRVEASQFPLALDLSSADSMMGQPLPQKVSIEARLTSNGNVMAKTPGEPRAFADNIGSGIKLAMTLK